jgi:hypothetical protein
MSQSPNLKTERDSVTETLFSSYLEPRAMDNVHKLQVAMSVWIADSVQVVKK